MSPRAGTDAHRVWEALRLAGPQGVHSFDLRQVIHTGNPSQRIADIEDELELHVPRYRERRGRRYGVRYFHPDHAPAGAGGADGPSGATVSRLGRPNPSRAADSGRQVVTILDYRDPTNPTESRREWTAADEAEWADASSVDDPVALRAIWPEALAA